MSGVAKAVERLVTAATSGAKDAALRGAVNDVLESFDASNAKDVKAALGALEAGMAKAEGRAAQVLNLALGALVEGGASADLAWPAASRGLVEALEEATSFARACVEKSKKQLRVVNALTVAAQVGFPEWLDVNEKEMRGVFKAAPNRDDVLPDINENLVVELYSK